MERTPAQTCEDFMRLIEHVKHSLFALAEEQGLTRVQLFALYSIDRSGGLGMGQVADVLHCDASNVTGLVDRLMAQDLVMRKESEQDRRTKLLQLTSKGQAVVAALNAGMTKRLGCEKLTPTERTLLHTTIQKIC